MTMLFANGFDQYATKADIESDSEITGVAGDIVFVSASGAFYGASSIKMSGRTIDGDAGSVSFGIQSNTSTTLFIGLDWKASDTSAGIGHFQFYDSIGNLLLRSRTNGFKYLELVNGDGAEIMEVQGVATNNANHHISVAITFHKTNGSYAYYVDGVLVDSATGVDTSHNSSADDIPKSVNFNANMNNAGHDCYFDNYYVNNDLGSTNNTRLGRVAILNIVPDSDNSVDFTPSVGGDNFANVDQVDGDSADYNESSSVGDEDLYGHSDLPATGDDILSVQHMARVVDPVNGTAQVVLHTNTGANDNQSPSIVADNTDLKYGEILEYQDGISVPWNEAAVNAIVAGVEVV